VEIDGMRVFHLVARVDRRLVSLVEVETGWWVWERLRAAFPWAIAVCLMPDHPHVVALLEDPEAARRRLNRLLGRLACRLGVRFVGEAAEPKEIANHDKLLRELRYVALNPPRARLTDDPLAWTFSTHRDVVGATVDPWIDADRLARVLRRPRRGFVEWYHRYVSADPSVQVSGTSAPRPAAPTDVATHPLATIAAAAAAAVRQRPDAIRRTGIVRDLFVGLAREQGWRAWDVLADACDCTTRAIRFIADRLDPKLLDPARLCLGDPRLR
jgi:hypothetical protein